MRVYIDSELSDKLRRSGAPQSVYCSHAPSAYLRGFFAVPCCMQFFGDHSEVHTADGLAVQRRR